MACCRYVELNPVRAGIVDDPGDYRWSSYRYKVELDGIDWLDLDPCYKGLGRTKKECENRYKEWVKASIPDGEWEMIRKAVQRSQLTGSNLFIEEVAKRMGKRVEFRGRGRPRKVGK